MMQGCFSTSKLQNYLKSFAMRFYLLLTSILICIVACKGEENTNPTTQSKIVHISNFDSKYVAARNIDIWLPANYSKSEKYAVLYMHDGQMLFDSTTTWNKQEWGVDETMNQLITAKTIQPCIVIGIWNSGPTRQNDYMPQKPFESLTNDELATIKPALSSVLVTQGQTVDLHADNYLRFIVEELKPYIDSHYSTNTDQQHTFIAGSSYGGLISWYAMCEYPNTFGGAACLSTHWTGLFTDNDVFPQAFYRYLQNHLPNPQNHKIYFDYGTETLDALYEKHQLKVDTLLMQKGFDSSHWETLNFQGADHSENAWKRRLSIPLTFLLSHE